MDKIFLNSVKESLQAEVDWETHRIIDRAIKELNDMRPNKIEGATQTDEGIYEYECKNCGNEFAWGDSAGENKYQYCQMCAEQRIAELEEALPIVKDVEKNEKLQKKVNDLETKIKTLSGHNSSQSKVIIDLHDRLNKAKDHIKYIQFNGEYPEMECDECGEKFIPEARTVKIRTSKAYCYEHTPKADQEEIDKHDDEQIAKEMGLKEPRISMEPKDVARRSESQQLRRALEKQRATPKTDCIQCGKLTAKKLYCSDACRKEYEKQLHIGKLEQPIKFKPIIPGEPEYSNASRDDWEEKRRR